MCDWQQGDEAVVLLPGCSLDGLPLEFVSRRATGLLFRLAQSRGVYRAGDLVRLKQDEVVRPAV